MKNLILIILISMISLSTMGQRFHADNNIRDIKLTSKKFKKDPITYNIVEKFGMKFYIMPNTTGESELPFEIVFYKDLKKDGFLLTGEQTMVPEKIYAAKPLLNNSGAHVDEFHPDGLTARKKRRQSGKLYLERGDFEYRVPERIKVEGIEYFIFCNNKKIIATPVDGDINDRIDLGNMEVSFINQNDFYVFEEVYSGFEENDKLDKPVRKAPTQKTQTVQTEKEQTYEKPAYQPVYHFVKKGESLSVIAKKYGLTVEQLKRINGLVKDIIQPGQRLRVG